FSTTNAVGLELNARLYDVFPNGTAVLVDRGPRRISPDEAASGVVTYQLHGNGWRFPAGHRIRLELAQDDDPYLKRSAVPWSASPQPQRGELADADERHAADVDDLRR